MKRLKAVQANWLELLFFCKSLKISAYTEGSPFEKVQLQLDKNRHNSDTFSFNFVINTDRRYALDGHSNIVKYLSLFGHFDSDRGAGGGLTITY
jgi:hypothetical protein